MSWAEARDPSMYRPIAIALLMRFLQQLTGITPVLVYLQSIFHSTAVLLVSAPAPALLEAPAALGPAFTWPSSAPRIWCTCRGDGQGLVPVSRAMQLSSE